MSSLTFSFILFGLKILLFWQSIRFKKFRIHVAEKNFTAQIKSRDNSVGRWFKFENGRITSSSGINNKAEVVLTFKNPKIACNLLMPLVMAFLLKKSINQLDQINALKDFVLTMDGPDELTLWFTQTLMKTQTIHLKFGTDFVHPT